MRGRRRQEVGADRYQAHRMTPDQVTSPIGHRMSGGWCTVCAELEPPPLPTTRTAPGTPRDRTRAQQAQTHTNAGSARNTSHRMKHFTPTFTPAKTLHTTLRACSAHPRRSPAPRGAHAPTRTTRAWNSWRWCAKKSTARIWWATGPPPPSPGAPCTMRCCPIAAHGAPMNGRRCTRWRANSRADASARRRWYVVRM